MFAKRRVFTALLLILAVSTVTAQPPRGDGTGRTDVRGLVKSVDASAGTITIIGPVLRDAPTVEKTYSLTASTEIALDNGRRGVYQPGTLKEIVAGSPVSLTLTADQKTVESVLVEGAFVRGTVKAVDVQKRLITVTRGGGRGPDEAGEEKTYSAAVDAEIIMDDGRGRRFSAKVVKLEHLATGSVVSLQLSANQKQIVGVMVEGMGVIGLVKSVDAAKNTITVTNPSRGDAGEDQTLTVAPDTLLLVDDGGGRRLSVKEVKLVDIPVGSVVNARLSLDQKTATVLRAEGAPYAGILKAVDTTKGTITVLRPSRTDPSEEKVLKITKGARIMVDGKNAAVGDLKPGDETFVMVRLSLDQKAVTSISVGRGR